MRVGMIQGRAGLAGLGSAGLRGLGVGFLILAMLPWSYRTDWGSGWNGLWDKPGRPGFIGRFRIGRWFCAARGRVYT